MTKRSERFSRTRMGRIRFLANTRLPGKSVMWTRNPSERLRQVRQGREAARKLLGRLDRLEKFLGGDWGALSRKEEPVIHGNTVVFCSPYHTQDEEGQSLWRSIWGEPVPGDNSLPPQFPPIYHEEKG